MAQQPFVDIKEIRKIAENIARNPEKLKHHEQKVIYLQTLVIQQSRVIAEQLALVGVSAVYLNDEISMGSDGIGAIIEELLPLDLSRIGIIDHTTTEKSEKV